MLKENEFSLLMSIMNFLLSSCCEIDIMNLPLAIVTAYGSSVLHYYLFLDVTALTSYWQNEYHHLDLSTKVDSTYLTFYLSFMRMTTTRLVADTTTQCQVLPERLLQVHLFQRSDRTQGLLVLFEAVDGRGTKVVLESHMMMRQHYTVINPLGPAGRLINLEVRFERISNINRSVFMYLMYCIQVCFEKQLG